MRGVCRSKEWGRLIIRLLVFCFFSSRRRHTRYWRDWSSDVCSSDLTVFSFRVGYGWCRTGGGLYAVLFIGDDWAEAHHDIELVDEDGRRLARRRLPEGIDGLATLHALVADHPAEAAEAHPVAIGIETDRRPWVGALLVAGRTVHAINPLEVARYRERHATAGAKSDPGDAHVLAELVRLDRAHHRPVAGDSALAEHLKVLTRTSR